MTTRRSEASGTAAWVDKTLSNDPDSVALSPTLSPPPPVSGARYVVEANIAVGGMGQVDDCFDPALRRRVAVKRLASSARADDKRAMFERMLDREACLTASLEHPSIIPIYDASFDEGGRYYVMRLVTQQTLADLLDGMRNHEVSHGLWRLLRDFVQVCRGVAYANSRGVVHCDLKPSNILTGPFGEVLIVDWGLAYSKDDDFVPRGGTPSYMAPEQLEPERQAFDARTDVFALGAILYEILCLSPPFSSGPSDEEAIIERMRHKNGADTITPPSERNPSREIPPILEEIAMRAMSLEPTDRWKSAIDLAQAVEDFLEGKKELERRRQKADELVRHGDELAPRYHELVACRPAQLDELATLRRDVRPWDPARVKAPLWAAQERVAVTDALRLRTLHAAAGLYEQALELVPDHETARRRLAQLYASELREAQARRDDLAAIHFEELARQYDDDALWGACGDRGRLEITGQLPDAVLSLTQLMSRDRRLVPATAPKRVAAPSEMTLARGSYIISVDLTSGQSIKAPVCIRPGKSARIELDERFAAELAEDEVLVPGGEALLGGDSDDASWSHGRRCHVDTFAIQRWPLSFADYLLFLDHMTKTSPRRVSALLPRNDDDKPLWRFDNRSGGYQPTSVLDDLGRDVARRLPLFGVDVASAEAYAAWLSEARGARYDLPDDQQWEKAARGVDGRKYPWGDHFDASFCKMRDSRPGRPRPEPADVFELDESPHGVRAMAGTIAEWVRHATGSGHFTRGGAWCDSELDCRLSSRRFCDPRLKSTRVGVRLVRELTSPGDGEHRRNDGDT